MVVDTLISLGIMGILLFIASKMEMFNDLLHEIRDMLKGGLPPPPPLAYDAEKHSDCYPMM